MRLTSALVFHFLFAAAALPQLSDAQAAESSPSAETQNCPIDFQVKKQTGVVAHDPSDKNANVNTQGLEFRFSRLNRSRIASADITVVGDASRGQLLPLDKDRPDAISETFHVAPQSEAPGVAIADTWTKKVIYVRSTELTSIRYADGTVWHRSKASQCRAQLSGILLTSR